MSIESLSIICVAIEIQIVLFVFWNFLHEKRLTLHFKTILRMNKMLSSLSNKIMEVDNNSYTILESLDNVNSDTTNNIVSIDDLDERIRKLEIRLWQ